ncbi:hypothetical protein [uncultured Gammaproteobacteria bacterium]|nr:hypothetical protein [uncultured Gammaproteobacteria bacterium]
MGVCFGLWLFFLNAKWIDFFIHKVKNALQSIDKQSIY